MKKESKIKNADMSKSETSKLKAILITNKGIEYVAVQEVKELINEESEVKDRVILFEADLNSLCYLTYMSRTAIRVMILLDTIKFNELEDIKVSDNYKSFLQNRTFVVRSLRVGEHNFSSLDIEKHIATSMEGQADLKNPEMHFLAFINNNVCYFGIDLAGFDLSKRDYKVFGNKDSLKGSIAYSALRIADWNPKKILVDTFAKDGSIVIEAAFHTNGVSPNFFRKEQLVFTKFHDYDFKDKEHDKELHKLDHNITALDSSMNSIAAVKKNSKIAGVENLIDARKASIDWLDLKVDERSVDFIITYYTQPAKHKTTEKDLDRYCNEFFYQAEYILKEDGTICLITRDFSLPVKFAEKYEFKLIEKHEVMQGAQKLFILVFRK